MTATQIPFPHAVSSDEALANAKHCLVQSDGTDFVSHQTAWIAKAQAWAQIALAMPMTETVELSTADRTLAIMRAFVAMHLAEIGGGPFILTDRDLAVWSDRQMIVHEETSMGLVSVRLDEP